MRMIRGPGQSRQSCSEQSPLSHCSCSMVLLQTDRRQFPYKKSFLLITLARAGPVP